MMANLLTSFISCIFVLFGSAIWMKANLINHVLIWAGSIWMMANLLINFFLGGGEEGEFVVKSLLLNSSSIASSEANNKFLHSPE